MNASTASLQPYLEGFAALPQAPAQLHGLREAALQRALNRGFPGPRDEAWKYTSTAALERRRFAPVVAAPRLDPAAVAAAAIPTLDAWRLVFVNGRYQAGLSTLPTHMRARTVDAGDADGLPPPTEWEQDTFFNLNTALFQDGLLLDVDEARRDERPLEVLYLVSSQNTPLSQHPRCMLRMAPRARCLLIERFVGCIDGEYLTNAGLQVELRSGARLEHVRLQSEGQKGFHLGRAHIRQAAGSEYICHELQLGGAWSRLDLHVSLEEPGARVQLNGFYAVSGRRHTDSHTRIDHLVPHTCSDELYHGILDGQGRAVFNGKVVVAKQAVKTDARQANHNLLLSRGAEIDTKPELEIYADDVKCSHGASIGQLDAEQLFYLRSRGLDASTARQLLLTAFAEVVLERLPLAPLRSHARERLAALLPQINPAELQ